MKSTAALACLASGAVAVPRQVARQSPEDITDQYMFELTLSEFSSRHAAKDPSTLIWETDGCTSSPDNPFGFKFLVSDSTGVAIRRPWLIISCIAGVSSP